MWVGRVCVCVHPSGDSSSAAFIWLHSLTSLASRGRPGSLSAFQRGLPTLGPFPLIPHRWVNLNTWDGGGLQPSSTLTSNQQKRKTSFNAEDSFYCPFEVTAVSLRSLSLLVCPGESQMCAPKDAEWFVAYYKLIHRGV